MEQYLKKKTCTFVTCTLPLTRSTFLKTHAAKQHACLVDSLFLFFVFVFVLSSIHVFATSKKAAQSEKKRAHVWEARPIFRIGPQNSQRLAPIQDVGFRKAHSEFWRGPRGPELAGHPVSIIGIILILKIYL